MIQPQLRKRAVLLKAEDYLLVLKKFRKRQNPLSQELKRGAQLKEHALSGLYPKIMHTKYSINLVFAEE